jgi:5-methylcytosine-specific restriction endonuclease McrA
VKRSSSYKEVSERLGIKRYTVTKYIKNYDIDISHFRPGRGRLLTKDEVLLKNSKIRRGTVRNVIIRENLIEYKCGKCGQGPEWNGSELSLQLDHRDGDPSNNELSNLRFLCPNCHSQTSTYCGRNYKCRRE